MKINNNSAIKTLFLLIASAIVLTACNKDNVITPVANVVDPGQGAGNEVVTLTGSGLKEVESITFDNGNVPAAFNPNFNTDNAIIFRVPAAANVGAQHIIFKKVGGYQFSVPFTVLAIPSITSSFPEEWEAGSLITITGNYLETVSHVALQGSSDTAIIMSASSKQLVLQMPASDVSSAKLAFTNIAGTTVSSFSFINLDKQLKFFTEDFASGMQNWSWTKTSGISSAFAVSGTNSLEAIYGKDGYQGLSFHYDFDLKSSDYTALSFWLKGGTVATSINVKADGVSAGTATDNKIAVPADVWTHFTLPITGHFDGLTFNRMNFQMDGPPDGDQIVYFDNVVLIK